MVIKHSSLAQRKITGTLVITITYGFSGYLGENSVNSTASSTLQFDFEDQNIIEVVEQLRGVLIDNLRQSLQSAEVKQKFGVYAQRIFDLYHVISETQMFIP